MNLDELHALKKIDSLDMLAEIDGLPAQLQSAWELGQGQPLPTIEGVTRILIAGMGGSAIGADLLAAYLAPLCKLPVVVHRDYGLPAWAAGPETLVIASSHSGNTEETLEAYEAALGAGCRLMAVATGGKLAERARAGQVPLWQFVHPGQPRAAVGFSFGLLLAAFDRLGLIPPQRAVLEAAVADMRSQQKELRADVPTVHNPAKRMAGQLVGRWVNVFGSGALAPVARRWKGQVNELAKAGAGFEFLPEADHNTLAGTLNPSETLAHTTSLFLRAPSDHPRNRARLDLTRQAFMLEGLNTDVFDARGAGPLSHVWTALHFGDYSAFFLAIAYGTDPTPVTVLENFKASMKAAK